jgi:peroxiredoxin
MAELRGLGAITDDLAAMGVQLFAVSVDEPALSNKVVKRARLPFSILADEQHAITGEFALLHRGGGPGDSDIPLPAHVLIDQDRQVRWTYVSDKIQNRLSPDSVLEYVRTAIKKDS